MTPVDEPLEQESTRDRDQRRQVERPERRQQPAEDPEVRLADVVEEALERQREYGSRIQR